MRKINATVIWDNNSGGIQHDVVFDSPGSPANIGLHTAGTNSRQFAAAGTYAFHCTVHGTANTGMHGTVVAQ